MKIEKSKTINGDQLAEELGLPSFDVYLVEGDLIVNSDKTDDEIVSIYQKHKPKKATDFRAQALEKLLALGLTQEEIAAL